MYSEVYDPELDEGEATELLEKVMFLREGGFSGMVEHLRASSIHHMSVFWGQ